MPIDRKRSVKSALLMVLPLVLLRMALAAEPDAPADGVVQVVSVTGHAVFAPNRNALMSYGGEHQLDRPQIQLKPGQWLHAGNAVLVRENASVILRWRDGEEQQLGPGKTMLSMVITPPHVAPPAMVTGPSAPIWLLSARTIERQHQPLLVFVLGVLLVLAPLMRRRPYQAGLSARFVAAALFIALTLPVSIMLFARQLGRMAWYQPPQPGVAWTGAAANLEIAADLAGFLAMVAGVCALWVLSISLVSGGSARLRRRSWRWWTMCLIFQLSALAGYLSAYAPNIDYESAWYRFWGEWARYYGIGTWLLLPVAQLVACARPAADPANANRPWQGAAASGLVVVFLACYTLGYDREYDVSMGERADQPASRAEAQRWICAAPNVFVGTASNFRVLSEPGCGSSPPRSPGDLSGLLQRCEMAEVDVRVGEVLRSPNLLPGQTIAFQVAHARIKLDELQQRLQGKHLFYTREQDVDGRSVHIGAARTGVNRLSPLNFNNAGDAVYARTVVPACSQ